MEHKLNIAAILKDKPQGTKLYNLLYNINVELDTIVTTGTKTIVWCTDKFGNTDVCHRFYSEFGTIEGYPDGLQILFPSKEMRNWSKFAWKRGDALNTIIHNNIYEIYNFFQERIKDICSRHKAFKPIEIFDEWGLEKDHVTFCGEEEFDQEGGWWSPEEVIRIDLSKVTKEMSL